MAAPTRRRRRIDAHRSLEGCLVARSRSALHRPAWLKNLVRIAMSRGYGQATKYGRDLYRRAEARRGLRWRLRAVARREYGATQDCGWLGPQSKRIGIEANGGYEHAVVTNCAAAVSRGGAAADAGGLAKFQLQRAKKDKIDAALITACTARSRRSTPRPIRGCTARRTLTLIEQIDEDKSRTRSSATCREPQSRIWAAEIAAAKRSAQLTRCWPHPHHRDLAQRLELIQRHAGEDAVAILLCSPRSALTREQAAALASSPHDRSGEQPRAHIEGGAASAQALHRSTAGRLPLEPQLCALQADHRRHRTQGASSPGQKTAHRQTVCRGA